MEESNKIKSTDLIEKDVFDNTIKSAKLLEAELSKLIIGFEGVIKAGAIALNKKDDPKSASDIREFTHLLNEQQKARVALNTVLITESKLKQEFSKQLLEENKVRKANQSEILKQAKEQEKLTSEYAKGVKRLAEVKKELKELSFAGKQNTESFKNLSKEFGELDKKVRGAEQGVGEFFRNVGNYPKQLKELQKALMNLEPGTEEFERLSKEAGLLKDKIGDTKDAIKAMSSDSKLTQGKTLFGQIGSDLADLNFSDASDKAIAFAGVIKSISFVEIIGGLKNFGMAIVNVGKALLLNPFVLVATAIALLGKVIYDGVTAWEEYGKASKTAGDQAKESSERIEESIKKQTILLIRLNELKGKITKDEASRLVLEAEQQEKRKENVKNFSEQIRKLAQELEVNLADTKGGKFDESYTGDYQNMLNRMKFNRELKKMTKQFRDERLTQVKEEILETSLVKEQADSDALKKLKEEHKKTYEANKKAKEDRQKLRDQEIIEDMEKKEALKQKGKDIMQKYNEGQLNEKTTETVWWNKEQGITMDQHEIDMANIEITKAKAKKDADDLLDSQLKMFAKVTNEYGKELENRNRKKIDSQQEEIERDKEQINRQRDLAKEGKANQLAFEEQQLAKDELKKQQLEEKAQKQKEIIQLTEAYFNAFNAELKRPGANPTGASTRALTDVLLAKGVAKGLAVLSAYDGVEDTGSGGRVDDKGGFVAVLHPHERVMTANQNKKTGGLKNEELSDIAYRFNNGLLIDANPSYMVQNTVNVAEKLYNGILIQQNKEIINSLEELIAKPIQHVDVDKFGNLIETVYEKASKKVVIHKAKLRI